MGAAMEREQSGMVTAQRVAGQEALGRALGLLSGGAVIAAIAAAEGPDVVALAIGVGLGLLLVLFERLLPANSTFWGVRRADEVTAPIDVARERWWSGPLGWGTNAFFVITGAAAAREVFGEGAEQFAVFALVIGAAHLASWFAIRRVERARESVAVELASNDADDDPRVVLYRRADTMAAFGR